MGIAALLLGENNPFTQWAGQNQNLLNTIGSGLGQGQNIQSGLSAGLAGVPQAKALDRADAEKAKADAKLAAQTNATQLWLEQNHPDLAQMVGAGMPVSEAWQTAIARMTPSGGGDPYTLAPGQVRYGPDNKPIASVPNEAAGTNFDDISGLRKEVLGLPSYKNMTQAKPIYDAMLSTAGTNTRASDLNLVYGLGKIMDPGSVVREGEMFMVQGINSLPQKLIEGINSLLTGQSSLDETTRKQILDEAYKRMAAYEGAYSADTSFYGGIADRYKINPNDIYQQFKPAQQWAPPSADDPFGIR